MIVTEITLVVQEYLVLTENIVGVQSWLCLPQMQVTALSCREEAICEHDPEMTPFSANCALGKLKFLEILALVLMELGTCISGTAPSMLKGIYIYRFYSNICSHPDDVFFGEDRAYFSEIILNHILHLLHRLQSRYFRTENIWCIMKCKFWQRRIFEQLESSIRQE